MESTAGIAHHQGPRFAYLHHISLPCNDVEESKRFFIEVMGGEPMATSDPETFTEVRLKNRLIC